MTTRRMIYSTRDGHDARRLHTTIPEGQRITPDGAASHSLIRAMALQAAHGHGPSGRRSIYVAPAGPRYVHLIDDAWRHRDTRTSEVLHALTDHAASRAIAAGYRHAIYSCSGACEYWTALCTRDDFTPVLLAALDWQATGSRDVADWYLATRCYFRWCHPDAAEAVCGSPTCGAASPDTVCVCVCGGVNHGMGKQAGRSRPAPPEWNSMPRLAWFPGLSLPKSDELAS